MAIFCTRWQYKTGALLGHAVGFTLQKALELFNKQLSSIQLNNNPTIVFGIYTVCH